MKILLVSPTFPPRRFGGMTIASYNLGKSLVELGHGVTVYTTDVNDTHSRIRDAEGVKSMEGMHVRYFKNLINLLAARRLYLPKRLVTVTKTELKNFDVIHLNEFRSLLSIIVHHYAKKYSIPYVLQAHGSVGTYFQKGVLKRVFDRIWGCRILKDASKVIALTSAEAEQYKRMGVSEGKIEIVPNGINLSEFENLPRRGEFRRKYRLNQNQKIILYLNRINKVKGPDLLVKSFAELSKEIDKVKLIIAGPDDGYLPILKKLLKELAIEEKVIFTGPLYGRDKLRAYVGADVYVLPSRYEAFPIGVLEAFACGTAVIVTDHCGIADVINDQAGLVVPWDKEQLSKAMLYMLSDNEKRREFGEKGRLLVREKFNWEKVGEQVEQVYLGCTSSKC
jgi:glycosyltransferase involved in cell wall biosynthesis